jgi:DNA-directed RNA polymerase III subunit RPC1
MLFRVQTCARILVPEPDRTNFLKRAKHPAITYLARKALRKKILEKCKKATACFYCGDDNGPVRKAGMLKISHDKYKKWDDNSWEREKCKSKAHNFIFEVFFTRTKFILKRRVNL